MTAINPTHTHFIYDTESGAECSCGRVFSVWDTAKSSGWSAADDLYRTRNLVRANAARHAKAAKARAEREQVEKYEGRFAKNPGGGDFKGVKKER